MERVCENGTVYSVKFVQCSPEQLRQIADRMELAINQRSLPGETLYYELTSSILLIHQPNLTLGDFQRKHGEEDPVEQEPMISHLTQ